MIILPDKFEIIVPDDILEKYKIDVSSIITEKDAVEISNFIIDENKEESHMIEKPVDEICGSANEYGGLKFSVDGNIVGFMGLYKFHNLYEAGSLCLWKEYQKLGLGQIIQKLLIDNFAYLPIFLVTNVDKVKHISEKSGMKEIKIEDLPEYILGIIEEGGKLLSDDSVYLNKHLFANKSFYSLIENEDEEI